MDTHSLAEGIVRLTQGMQDVAVNVRAIAAEVKALSYASPQKKMYTNVSTTRTENQKSLEFNLMTPPPRLSSSSSSVSAAASSSSSSSSSPESESRVVVVYKVPSPPGSQVVGTHPVPTPPGSQVVGTHPDPSAPGSQASSGAADLSSDAAFRRSAWADVRKNMNVKAVFNLILTRGVTSHIDLDREFPMLGWACLR